MSSSDTAPARMTSEQLVEVVSSLCLACALGFCILCTYAFATMLPRDLDGDTYRTIVLDRLFGPSIWVFVPMNTAVAMLVANSVVLIFHLRAVTTRPSSRVLWTTVWFLFFYALLFLAFFGVLYIRQP